MKRRPIQLCAAAMAVLLFAAGCGGDDSGGGTAEPTTGGGAAATTGSTVAGGLVSGASDSDADPIPGGTLVYATDYQPLTGGLDPYVTSAFANQNVLVQIYQGLLTRDDEGAIVPSLATDWEKVDETTYRFTLRDGVTFQDGTPFTADDVVFSYDTMRTPPSAQAGDVSMIASVAAIDPATVEFKLKAPSASFINIVSFSVTTPIVSKAWYSTTAPDARQKTANGTGPFKLSAWTDGVSVALVKNPSYWEEGLPYLDGLTFQIVSDEVSRFAALRQGTDVDAAWIRDPALTDQAADEGFNVGHNASTRTMQTAVDATQGPLADKRVRQAVSKAIDREALIGFSGDPSALPSLQVSAGDPSSIKPDDSTPNYTYDPDGARALLAEAGDEHPVISLTYPTDASYALDVPIMEAIAAQLEEVGFKVELHPTTWAEVLTATIAGKFTGLLYTTGLPRPDIAAYFRSFLAPGAPGNKTGADGAKATQLWQTLEGETDPAVREETLKQLEWEVADNMFTLIPFATAQRHEIWSTKVKGYHSDPYSWRIHLKEAWLDDAG